MRVPVVEFVRTRMIAFKAGCRAALQASRTDWDAAPHRIYPPMDPDDPLGLTVGDCGPTQPRRSPHRCTPGCNPGNCPREDF